MKTGQLRAVAPEVIGQHLGVVEAGDHHLFFNGHGQPLGIAELEVVLAVVVLDSHQSPRLGAVPAAADLHNPIPAGVGPGQEDRIHRGQGAAGREADPLHSGSTAENLRGFTLELFDESGLQAPAGGEGIPERLGDDCRIVSENVGVMSLPEIEDALSVFDRDAGSPGITDTRRKGSDQAEVVASPVNQSFQSLLV